MSSNEKVICCLCETTVIKKNLKTHYTLRHPNEDSKYGVFYKVFFPTTNDVRNFFSGNPQQAKRKDCEIDEIEGISQTADVGNKRSRLEDTPENSDVDCSKGDEGPSTPLQELLKAIKDLQAQLKETTSKSSVAVETADDLTMEDYSEDLTDEERIEHLTNSHSIDYFESDQELTAYLTEEIENETNPDLPKLEDFTTELNGVEVTLTKKMDNEIITIKSKVSNCVDVDEMKAKPEFTIGIQKGKKVLSFLCTFSQRSLATSLHFFSGYWPLADENKNVFEISEISLHEGEFKDSTYTVSGESMDDYFYELLINYLDERGISNQFAEKLIEFFTSYDRKLYMNLLKGMKSFVEK